MANRKLLIATRSAGKFPEIVAMLHDLPFALVNLNEVDHIPHDYEVEEPAMTFEGNAIIKAMTFGKHPKAVRAVAQACASNPVAVVIPCHRVLPKTGGAGGYRWGTRRKQQLLALEAARTDAAVQEA